MQRLLISACTGMTGLGLALSPIAIAQETPAPQRVEITMRNFRFAPETVTLEAGKRYTLRIVNDSRQRHDFIARSFFANARLARLERSVPDGRIALRRRGTREVTLTAPGPGTYPIHSAVFGDSAWGMRGYIIVK